MATHPTNPHPPQSYRWWIAEGRISEEDGHPDAARAAYNQAVEAAPDDDARWLAAGLRDGVPAGRRD